MAHMVPSYFKGNMYFLGWWVGGYIMRRRKFFASTEQIFHTLNPEPETLFIPADYI